jgi:hypothetical protein
VVFFEILGYHLVHITELAAVAFIKDNDNMLIKYGVPAVFLNESGQLWDSRKAPVSVHPVYSSLPSSTFSAASPSIIRSKSLS